MALVVPDVHHTQIFSVDFVKNVIRKASQIRAAKTLIDQMKTQWVYNCLSKNEAHFMIEFPGESFGNAFIVSESFE